jgi:hypothetical protein
MCTVSKGVWPLVKVLVGLIIKVPEKEGCFEEWAWRWPDPVGHLLSTLGLRFERSLNILTGFSKLSIGYSKLY